MADEATAVDKAEQEGAAISVGHEWVDESRVKRRKFPGPAGVDVPLRVVLDPGVMTELHAHARETLEQEVGGVLAGDLCQDDHGPFVHIRALVRALHAKEGRTDLTFTQETWDSIHKSMEKEHPKYQILGWYHTHPGYGVEFSDMDLFIQRNFFPAPTQLALVTDPLSGEIAVCTHTDQGIRYVDRIWLDGREQKCKLPRRTGASPETASSGAAHDAAPDWGERLDSVERRLTQVIQAFDEHRDGLYRFQVILAMIFCVAVVAALFYNVYSTYKYRTKPPEKISYMRLPVRVGGQTVLLGVEVVDWQIPPELDPYVQLQKEFDRRLREQGIALPPAPAAPQMAPGAPLPAYPPPEATVTPPRTSPMETPTTAPAQPAGESPAQP
ncbi:MAG: Mov34/MPN/PAD-1 family protein [Armatimonadetes bacterium]|nr:Mov34/MPN/PAD-1 family protein [Armatimonadota bacterium]